MGALSSIGVQASLLHYNAIRRQLTDRFPELDDQTLSDTLEGITDLREVLAEVVRSALDDEALAGGLSTRIAEMKARLDRLSTRAKRKRDMALQAMVQADFSKLVQADFSASVREGAPSVQILEEDKIPAAYWKPQPSTLDKHGILNALKSGTEIEGVTLSGPKPQLSVRTK